MQTVVLAVTLAAAAAQSQPDWRPATGARTQYFCPPGQLYCQPQSGGDRPVGMPGTPQFVPVLPPQLEPVKPVPQQPPQARPDQSVLVPAAPDCCDEVAAIQADLQKLRDLCGQTPASVTASLDGLSQRLTALERRIAASEQAIANINIDAIAARAASRVPPTFFRITDQRGPAYSTDYQAARPGSYVTLPFGPVVAQQ